MDLSFFSFGMVCTFFSDGWCVRNWDLVGLAGPGVVVLVFGYDGLVIAARAFCSSLVLLLAGSFGLGWFSVGMSLPGFFLL